MYGDVNPASLNNPVTGVHTAPGGTPPTGVMFIDQEVRVPISPVAPSLIAKVQLPLGTEKRSENKVTFDTKPVGPCVRAASGRYVPVNGAAPVASDTAPAELITVFTKLSPLPPLLLTRFKILPFGAIRFISRSPSQVCVILKVTLMLPTGTAGNPETFIVFVAPVALLSGIATLIAPDEVIVDAVVFNATLPPGQILAAAGVSPGGEGEVLIVNVAGFDISGKPPPEQVTTTRY